jgi:TetR/AcrR family fatty acid metabolism transcriptional regulator
MSPKPDVTHIRIPQILAAAMRVFARQGIEQSRMPEIAREAGLSKATLYLYFHDKEELIEKMFARVFEDNFSGLEELVDAPGPAAGRLQAGMSRVGAQMSLLAQQGLITYDLYAGALRRPKIRAYIRQLNRKHRSQVIALIRQGIARGEFRPIDPSAAALALGATFEGALAMTWLSDDPIDWEQFTHQVFCLFLEGLIAPTKSIVC